MLSYDEALSVLIGRSGPGESESITLEKAGRRILCEPLLAKIDSPRCDVSAMDGYAVRRSDLQPLDRPLEVIGESYPGRRCRSSIAAGQTVRIFTGAPLPAGADKILVQEDVRRDGSSVRLVARALPERDHIRRRGSDFRKGDVALGAGALVDARALLIASAVDATHVNAWRRPSVSVITAGDELCSPGTASASRLMVPDSLTGAVLMSARQWGGVPGEGILLPDSPVEIARAATEAIARSDVVVMIGGASTGDRDFAKAAFAGLELELCFSKVAIKPGKPVWYGMAGNCHILGLPGNPAAAMITARLFLAPLLYRMSGRGFERALDWQDAVLAVAMEANGPREAFVGAQYTDAGIAPIAGLTASSQLLLSRSEVIIRRPAGASGAPQGASVPVLRL